MVLRSKPQKTKKRATNVTVDESLLQQARELGINISAVLQKGLEQEVRERLRDRWLEDNRAAIDGYNARLARSGTFSDGLRRF